jgi:hypothetical protein
VIALLVLLPATLTAVRAAGRNRLRGSVNLAVGSAMASIGLTIRSITLATIWLDGPVALGLEPAQLVVLALTVVVGVLVVVPRRATPGRVCLPVPHSLIAERRAKPQRARGSVGDSTEPQLRLPPAAR